MPRMNLRVFRTMAILGWLSQVPAPRRPESARKGVTREQWRQDDRHEVMPSRRATWPRDRRLAVDRAVHQTWPAPLARCQLLLIAQS